MQAEQKFKESEDERDMEFYMSQADKISKEFPNFWKWFWGVLIGGFVLFALPYLLGHGAFFLRECKNLKCAVKDLKNS
jgi:hypothetical protein